jgi:hypothetical protein
VNGAGGPRAGAQRPIGSRVVSSADASFDVYGMRIRIAGWPEVVEAARLDLAWFETPVGRSNASVASGRTSDISLTVRDGPPQLERFGDLRASFVTTRNVVYQLDALTIVDYFGRVVVVFDRESSTVLIEGDELDLVHEATYLFVLSQVGEYLDAAGLLRLHALALAGAQGAVIVLLPAGGGKSTLALRALQDVDVRLLSDDTPLIDRRARVHAFPLRLGLSARAAAHLPPAQVRRIQRFEFPTKHVLAQEAFADRIAADPQLLRHIVLGQRSLGRAASLARVSRRRGVAPLVRDGVVGLGVAQMAEYVLQRGWRDVTTKAGTATRRAAICTRALAGAQTWELVMGRDLERNWSALSTLLH